MMCSNPNVPTWLIWSLAGNASCCMDTTKAGDLAHKRREWQSPWSNDWRKEIQVVCLVTTLFSDSSQLWWWWSSNFPSNPCTYTFAGHRKAEVKSSAQWQFLLAATLFNDWDVGPRCGHSMRTPCRYNTGPRSQEKMTRYQSERKWWPCGLEWMTGGLKYRSGSRHECYLVVMVAGESRDS